MATIEQEYQVPARVLTGPVEAFYSRHLKLARRFPKLHLDRACPGLEKTDPQAIASEVYPGVFPLGEDDTARPCRMCSLESVLLSVLRPRAKPNHHTGKVFVTFSSQGAPVRPDQRLSSYRWREFTPSGAERLARVARASSLELLHGSCGPVAYGMLPVRGVGVLSRNLRTLTRPTLSRVPSRSLVECVWALLDDNPPELALQENPDPWELAALLSS